MRYKRKGRIIVFVAITQMGQAHTGTWPRGPSCSLANTFPESQINVSETGQHRTQLFPLDPLTLPVQSSSIACDLRMEGRRHGRVLRETAHMQLL